LTPTGPISPPQKKPAQRVMTASARPQPGATGLVCRRIGGLAFRGSGIARVSAALAATDPGGCALADRLRARLFALSLEGT
jgi:hypothetical protein